MDRISLNKPTIGEEEIEAVNRVIRSGWLAAGKETEAFEKEFANYIGVKYAIFTNSGTSALKMAYKWVMEEGEDYCGILFPKNTFCATYSAYAEIDKYYERVMAFKEDTQIKIGDIVVNVHYGGVKDETPCLIEDSAHRIEPNDPLIGKIRIYSFYVTKNMTTGAGGMFVTDDKDIYERARIYWKDGLSTSTFERQKKGYDYDVIAMAGGYDGNDIAAAIGRVQLRKLPEFTKRRNEIVGRYNEAFRKTWTGNHLYPFGKNKKLIDFLKEKGISAGYYYPPDGFVCLPLYPLLTDSEVDYIIKEVKKWTTHS